MSFINNLKIATFGKFLREEQNSSGHIQPPYHELFIYNNILRNVLFFAYRSPLTHR